MYFLMQLTLGFEPDISHLRTFDCAVQMPIPPPQRTKMGLQCRPSIYVGFDSPSIIQYLEPMTGDLFTAWFADYPHTSECENEVNRIIYLQNIANRLLDAFNDASNITKSHIPAANALARIVVPDEHTIMDDDDTVPPKQNGGINESTNQTGHSEHALDEFDRNKIITDDIFAFLVAHEIINDDYDSEPRSIIECHWRYDWSR
ncbi:hypothetical protein Pfo_027413 [Paulownia fortunei]|nr:hypothetical protein Pfo_027413 [Paulownia fortunei]